MSTRDDGGWRRFEEEYREWAGREPRTEPRRAARLLVATLPDRRRAVARPWLAAAAVALALLGASLWMARHGRPSSTVVGTVAPSPVLQEGVVLWWIEPDTPVYFVLGPDEHGTGGVR
jgi:hypothetical protein